MIKCRDYGLFLQTSKFPSAQQQSLLKAALYLSASWQTLPSSSSEKQSLDVCAPFRQPIGQRPPGALSPATCFWHNVNCRRGKI